MANVSTDIPADATASPESDSATLQEAVDKLVSEIDNTIDSMTHADPTEDARSGSDAIDEQVDNLVTDASQASSSFEAPSIDELDARLATVADDEMDFEGEIESVEPGPAASAEAFPVGASSATTSLDDPAEIDVEGRFEAPEDRLDDDEVAGEFEAPVTAAPSADAITEDAASATEAFDAPQETSSETGEGAKTKSVDLSRVVSGGARSAAKIVNLPLARASRAQRDTIGWVALNTIFLAMCVWLYVLLIR